MKPSVQILSAYHQIDDPWGGGNNFWRALFPELTGRHGMSVRYLKDDPDNNPPPTDVIFFNQISTGPGAGSSIYTVKDLQNMRRRYPSAKFLIRAINLRKHARYNSWFPYWLTRLDQIKDRTIKVQMEMADFVIFQSQYQKGIFEKYDCGVKNSVTIHNGAPVMFAEKGLESPRLPIEPAKPIKLLTTSVSGNPRKRLELIARLSELPGVEITHAGFWHKEVKPRRVKTLGTITHDAISGLMNDADYYLKLSEGDMCPNALIEALAFGLPIIYDRDGGGAAEVGGPYGIAFDENDMPGMLETARRHHGELVQKIADNRANFLITRTADAYADVFRNLADKKEKAA